jgi:hypothetical protein
MEVGRSSVLTLRQGNKFVASTLDDGKRNEVVRHFPENIKTSVKLRAAGDKHDSLLLSIL